MYYVNFATQISHQSGGTSYYYPHFRPFPPVHAIDTFTPKHLNPALIQGFLACRVFPSRSVAVIILELSTAFCLETRSESVITRERPVS